MALEAKLSTKKINEEDKTVFEVEFTNGNIEQLKELAVFLKGRGFDLPEDETEKLKEVIKTGIAWLERLKIDSAAMSK